MSTKGYWDELHDQLIEKLNEFLRDQDKSEQLAYFFEPVPDELEQESEDTQIFTFTNPFKKYYIKFKKVLSKFMDHDVELVDKNVSEKELQEMLNALDHVEKQSKKHEIKNINSPHWDPNRSNEFPYIDYFETEKELIISLEVPNLSNDEIDIRASPYEL